MFPKHKAGSILARRIATAPAAAIGVLFALAVAPSAPQAKVYCSEPVLPFCVNRSGVFEDATSEERCRGEVEKFYTGMEEYVECLGRQQQEARDRAEEIKARFACMSRGEANCR